LIFILSLYILEINNITKFNIPVKCPKIDKMKNKFLLVLELEFRATKKKNKEKVCLNVETKNFAGK
tara:strand:+ start:804 stop:1001 length:198 start_codon:yes stop_codon:yes gene_type:complete